MKPLVLFLLLLALAPCVRAQKTDLIANTDGRKTTSLNGAWQTIVDPYESGYYNYRYQPSDSGYFKNAKPKSKTDLIEYDFDSSRPLKVPGDWNTQSDQLFFYEGTIWYKKSFPYQRKPNTRVFVYFGAANYFADVYLNGEKIGQHEGGFTPFNFEITKLVRDTGNFLVVKVDNKRRRDAVPTLMTDWWNYGGLTRDVKLVETPATFVNDYSIQLQKGSQDRIAGWVKLTGDKPTQRITIRIPEAGISKSFATDGHGFAKIDFSADLRLWSPENPKLYDVIVEAETDQVRDQIGFRSIETRGTDILLNGKPIFLRGVCIHEEAPIRGGRAYSREDARMLLSWAKELGANFVRLAHYPHNEFIVREADRMGIMVWSEIPVYWTILWENPATLENARNQLSEMITRDRNRAAIVIWSVANETPVGEPRLAFLKNLISHARSLDPTRLLSAAMERHYVNDTTQMIDDPLGEFLDVLGCNEYVGWYDGLPEKADRLEWKSKYEKPVVMSEFGGDALYGHHGDASTRWTEEYQESIYRHQIAMLKRIPFLRGTSPWILTDFRSPRRPLPKIQDYWNRKGLISSGGQKKKAFYVMQRWYRELQNNTPAVGEDDQVKEFAKQFVTRLMSTRDVRPLIPEFFLNDFTALSKHDFYQKVAPEVYAKLSRDERVRLFVAQENLGYMITLDVMMEPEIPGERAFLPFQRILPAGVARRLSQSHLVEGTAKFTNRAELLKELRDLEQSLVAARPILQRKNLEQSPTFLSKLKKFEHDPHVGYRVRSSVIDDDDKREFGLARLATGQKLFSIDTPLLIELIVVNDGGHFRILMLLPADSD